ncbi:MAG TPA: pseudouridine-5'-phosphate glycosidase [Rudaea sp.]|jgi:pseudouridine-5'-phosphate glycosidase|nr:pseudouridine-5'-phosphate glycosidase [Rudaea sp.]
MNVDPVFSLEVAVAMAQGAPVIALESTIVAHGLPWPDNLEIGRELEAAARAAGAVPATIAVFDGVVQVGLSDAQLERLAREANSFVKAGSADLPVIISRARNAATTVSATATLAARAGIRVFATGGVGGVHRGDALDVSSDLTTLARTQIALVSAGAKAILDLARTLEVLETLGVLVIGYRTDEFPAFYTRRSGLRLEHRCETVGELARVLQTRWALDQGGVLIANPIPEEAELPAAQIESAIAAALALAARDGTSGKALTPFLLSELARTTSGASVRANRALALDNVRVGAALAKALALK